jgi:tetratricopeptide (TPR) repeat protein
MKSQVRRFAAKTIAALAIALLLMGPASGVLSAHVPSVAASGSSASASQAGSAAEPSPATSLLDRLPRVGAGGLEASLAAARARGRAGAADLAWLQVFYGNAGDRHDARAGLRRLLREDPNNPEVVFTEFELENSEGHETQSMSAALQLLHLLPNDVASELAAREISATLDAKGAQLSAAAPELRQLLQAPPRDPATVYMLGRPLLALIGSPGIAINNQDALRLAGRLPHWRLLGPFGRWGNLSFDRVYPPERPDLEAARAALPAASPQRGTLVGHPFEGVRGMIEFPGDWYGLGAQYGLTYVQAPRPETILLRAYSTGSFKILINGVAVIVNDRRSRYAPAPATARFELPAGWSRILVKTAGPSGREFTLAMRSESGDELSDSADLPAGASLAGTPRLLPPPIGLDTWAAGVLPRDPVALPTATDPVALWADAVRREQDEDPETARVELQRATQLAPTCVLAWLSLADADLALPDAGQSWSSAEARAAAEQAIKADPAALPAYSKLGRIADSQGKRVEAAQEFVHCANAGYADCDWSLFRLDLRQHWMAEAAMNLGHALAESPSDWADAATALDFFNQTADQRAAADLQRRLQQDGSAHPVLARYLLAHGHPEAALPLLTEAVERQPSSPELRRDYIRALLETGDRPAAQRAAQQALNDFPDEGTIAAAAGEVALAESRAAGIAQLRQTEFSRPLIRRRADFLANDKFWMPWYHAAEDVIREAPGKKEYPNASSILVLDQMVDRINPDSSRDSYIHQVFRVLDAQGIQYRGQLSLSPGSDLISARTIKQDGSVLLPELRPNMTTISMPGLEPGDFVDSEYVMHTPPSDVVPRTLDNNMFFVFNSSREPYHYSDYIVLAPDSYPLLVDEERFPNPPVVAHHDGWTSREWLIRKTRLLGVEPYMPPEQELVPRVWISSQLEWSDISSYFADRLMNAGRATVEMQQTARQVTAGKVGSLAKAQALFDWVSRNLQPGEGNILSPARQYFQDRAGDRVGVFMALLTAARVPYQFALARAVTDTSTTKVPNIFDFSYPLVHVLSGANATAFAGRPAAGNPAAPQTAAAQAGADTGWFDLNNDFVRLGYILPSVRGSEALVVGSAAGNPFVRVPNQPSPYDGVVFSADAQVQPNGDANLNITLQFRGPTGEEIRQSLNSVPDARLPQIYQQLLLTSYPDAVATGGSISNRNRHESSLDIHIAATVPGFVHREDGRWEIERIAGPVELLGHYASLPYRVHPLLIPGYSFEEAHVRVTLPSAFSSPQLPADARATSPYGAFQMTYRIENGAVQFDRKVSLNADVVPADQYPDFRSFAETVDLQDRMRVMGIAH